MLSLKTLLLALSVVVPAMTAPQPEKGPNGHTINHSPIAPFPDKFYQSKTCLSVGPIDTTGDAYVVIPDSSDRSVLCGKRVRVSGSSGGVALYFDATIIDKCHGCGFLTIPRINYLDFAGISQADWYLL